jgi:hypothetical protein
MNFIVAPPVVSLPSLTHGPRTGGAEIDIYGMPGSTDPFLLALRPDRQEDDWTYWRRCVVEVRDDDADQAPTLVVEDVP